MKTKRVQSNREANVSRASPRARLTIMCYILKPHVYYLGWTARTTVTVTEITRASNEDYAKVIFHRDTMSKKTYTLQIDEFNDTFEYVEGLISACEDEATFKDAAPISIALFLMNNLPVKSLTLISDDDLDYAISIYQPAISIKLDVVRFDSCLLPKDLNDCKFDPAEHVGHVEFGIIAVEPAKQVEQSDSIRIELPAIGPLVNEALYEISSLIRSGSRDYQPFVTVKGLQADDKRVYQVKFKGKIDLGTRSKLDRIITVRTDCPQLKFDPEVVVLLESA